MSSTAFDPGTQIARELALPERGVRAVLALLDEGATVPFIARYRKEATGNLEDVQIRAISERREYLVDLEKRREVILEAISETGKLTPELERKIRAAGTKAELEDLYLPYKTKRRTRAMIAKERGLEGLADLIFNQPTSGEPSRDAQAFVSADKGVADVAAALAGARDIVAERIAESAEVRSLIREMFAREGLLVSEAVKDKIGEPNKFEQYAAFQESLRTMPSHRFLAIRRGQKEGFLKSWIDVDRANAVSRIPFKPKGPYAKELATAVDDAFERLIEPAVENDTLSEAKDSADLAAVDIFATNLRDLLLAAPLGAERVVGVDPGLRTGCKCVALDATGKFLDNMTLYLVQGEKAEEKSKETLLAFVKKHAPKAIAVGNGTGGRETEAFIKRTLKEAGIEGSLVVAVSESGASVYSASDIAREEHPDLDVTVRGAISIARRLQDPLAELVKIEPNAIGVGQYQHDVDQPLLSRKLHEVVESCVNHVGVELNTASAPLLAHVAGIGPALAKKIVKHRETKGAFRSRKDLLDVSGLGPRAFEQAAGFLRVRGASNPLDSSAVHPERYKLVERMAKDLGVRVEELVGNTALADRIELKRYIEGDVGEPTLRDIVGELKKPGRDPRKTFEPPKFRDDVNKMEDLKADMMLEGVVTNVTAFGAFVDIGVHQDGLIHVSELADRFVKDPHEVVKAGDRLTVRVLAIDLPRKRISLSAKTTRAQAQGAPDTGSRAGGAAPSAGTSRPRQEPPAPKKTFANNPFSKLRN